MRLQKRSEVNGGAAANTLYMQGSRHDSEMGSALWPHFFVVGVLKPDGWDWIESWEICWLD
jgi:hypothetical protein